MRDSFVVPGVAELLNVRETRMQLVTKLRPAVIFERCILQLPPGYYVPTTFSVQSTDYRLQITQYIVIRHHHVQYSEDSLCKIAPNFKLVKSMLSRGLRSLFHLVRRIF